MDNNTGNFCSNVFDAKVEITCKNFVTNGIECESFSETGILLLNK